MQENNFEKQVQQKMGSLELNPSVEVWQKLKVELEKKQDRKRGWFIFFLLLFCITGGSILWIKNSTTNVLVKENGQTNTFSSKNVSTSQKITESVQQNQPASSIENIAVSPEAKVTPKNLTSKIQSFYKADSAISISNIITPIHFNKENAPISGTDNSVKKQQQKLRKNIASKTTIQIEGVTVETSNAEDLYSYPAKQIAIFKLLAIAEKREKQLKTIDGQLIRNSTLLLNKKSVVQQLPSVENTTVKKQLAKQNKFSFIINFGIGQTATASNYLGATANRTYYDYAYGLNTSTGVPGSGNIPLNIPSTIKPAAGIFLGFAAANKITQRSNLSLGLQYQLMTTTISVGQEIVTTGGRQSYATGNSNSYLNKYHFIQIPVEFSSQLSHFKKHNLYFNAGASISQLLHTNSLQYNNIAGQYFIGNDYFNKKIIGLSAGFSINLLKDNEAPLLLGPSFSYSITSLAGKGLYDNSHYGFLGIRLQKVLKKK
jgi:hypothetical protein